MEVIVVNTNLATTRSAGKIVAFELHGSEWVALVT